MNAPGSRIPPTAYTGLEEFRRLVRCPDLPLSAYLHFAEFNIKYQFAAQLSSAFRTPYDLKVIANKSLG